MSVLIREASVPIALGSSWLDAVSASCASSASLAGIPLGLADSPLGRWAHAIGSVRDSEASGKTAWLRDDSCKKSQEERACILIQRAWRAHVRACKQEPADNAFTLRPTPTATQGPMMPSLFLGSFYLQQGRPHMFHSAKPRAWPQLYPRLTVRVPPPESELSPTDQAAIIATFFLPSEAKARTSSQHSLAPSGSNRNLSLFMQQHLKSMQREAEEALESLRWRSSQLASTVRSSASSMKRVSSSMVQLVAQAMVPKMGPSESDSDAMAEPLLPRRPSGILSREPEDESYGPYERQVTVEEAEQEFRQRLHHLHRLHRQQQQQRQQQQHRLAAPGIEPAQLLRPPTLGPMADLVTHTMVRVDSAAELGAQ